MRLQLRRTAVHRLINRRIARSANYHDLLSTRDAVTHKRYNRLLFTLVIALQIRAFSDAETAAYWSPNGPEASRNKGTSRYSSCFVLLVLVVQWLGIGLVIERSLVRLPAGALSSQLGQLSLPSLRGI